MGADGFTAGVGNFLNFTRGGKKDAMDSEADDPDGAEDEEGSLQEDGSALSRGASRSLDGGTDAHRIRRGQEQSKGAPSAVKTLTDDIGLEGLMLREAALKQALRTIPTFKIPEVPRFYDQELFEAKSVYDDLRRTQPTREDLISRQIKEEEQRRCLDYVAPRMLPPAPSNLDFEDVWRK